MNLLSKYVFPSRMAYFYPGMDVLPTFSVYDSGHIFIKIFCKSLFLSFY